MKGPQLIPYPGWTHDQLLNDEEGRAVDVTGPALVESAWETVVATFNYFRLDPTAIFRVRIRRARAKAIRDMVLNATELSLDTFNREIWPLESSAYIGGENVSNVIFGPAERLVRRLPELETALDDGTLQFHGNAIWGTATRVFAPMLRDDSARQSSIDEALPILKDVSLAPMEQARALQGVNGFGPNVSTGLVMVLHPHDFAIYNTPSRKAIAVLGFREDTLESFQRSAHILKERLDAEDFIELDWFLYCYGSGYVAPRSQIDTDFWWVNQGESYASEKQAGVLVAGKLSKTGNKIPHHETMRALRVGDVVLHYSTGAIRAVSQILEPAEELDSYPNFDAAVYLARTQYFSLQAPIRLTDIPEQWRIEVAGPFHQQGGVNQGYLYALPPEFINKLRLQFESQWPTGSPLAVPVDVPEIAETTIESYIEPPFAEIANAILSQGMEIDEKTIRRYHHSLHVRGFVILAGPSGTGKTWLTKAYADAVGARYLPIAVAPNWNSNEDLLGYFNPIDSLYHDTAFSFFLRAATEAYRMAHDAGVPPVPYHVCLDEMNLARVEYYFAAFLSAMEAEGRLEHAIDLHQAGALALPPNLVFVGTVNVDETTHGFADKVYDRAQLLELPLSRTALARYLAGEPYAELLLDIWDLVSPIAPFAFRIARDIRTYVNLAAEDEISWQEALDEQVLQKILPKLAHTDARLGTILANLRHLAEVHDLQESARKIAVMHEGFKQYGFASYF